MEGPLLGDRFRRAQRMARGRRGELFAGVDTRDEHPVQIEVIAASGYRVEDLASELDREVTLAERLPDGCLEARGWGHMAPDILFVARRWLGNLRPLDLTSGSLDQRLQRLGRVCERVQDLHRVGIVHRDVSMLSAIQTEQDVFLSGLRFAKAEGLPEPPPDARGFELSYLPCASPEVLEDPETADARADVFSLGVLLHMVLAGVPPYPGPTLAHVVRQHELVRSGRAPLPGPRAFAPQVSQELNEVCRGAVAPSPDDRFPSVASFLDELGRAIQPPSGERRPQTVRVSQLLQHPPTPRELSDPFASDEGQIPSDLLQDAPPGGGWGAVAAGHPPASAVSPPAGSSSPADESEALSPAEALALLEGRPPELEDAVTDIVPALPDRPPAIEPPPDDPTDEFEPLPEIGAQESGSGALPSDSGRLPASDEQDDDEQDPEDWEDDDSGEGGALPPSWVAAAEPLEDSGEDTEAAPSWVAQATSQEDSDLGTVEEDSDLGVIQDDPASDLGVIQDDPASDDDELIQPDLLEAPSSPEDDEADDELQPMDPGDALAALDLAVAASKPSLRDESPELDLHVDVTDEGGEVGVDTTELILDDPGASAPAAPPPPPAGAFAPPPPPPGALGPLPSLPELPTLQPPEPEPEPEPEPDPQPPEAFPFVEVLRPALIVHMPRGDFEEQVRCARAIVADDFVHLLLDLSQLNHLSGDQMGALTAIRSVCEQKDLEVAMFGLSKQVRFVATMMSDMQLPPALEASDAQAAIAEVMG